MKDFINMWIVRLVLFVVAITIFYLTGGTFNMRSFIYGVVITLIIIGTDMYFENN